MGLTMLTSCDIFASEKMPKRFLAKKIVDLKKGFLKNKKSALAKLAEEQIRKVGSLGQEILLMEMAR